MRIVAWLIAALVFMPAGASATGSEPPFGLWLSQDDPSRSSVELTVERTDAGWRASVDGEPTPLSAVDGEIKIEAAGDHRFFGTLKDDGSAIDGFWQQPATRTGYSRMITPVTLRAEGNNIWSGDIEMQPRPFRIFLDVFENPAGEPAAVIRNPERNEIMATEFVVEPEGDNAWTLVAGSGDRQVRRSLVKRNDSLVLDHSWFDEALRLQRVRPEDTVGYYPHMLGATPSRATPPPQLGDGWKVASPRKAGFDRAKLDAVVAELSAADPRERRPDLIHAVLVAHDGKLVVEEYFFGYDRETPHDTRSLGKVFAPVLVGALRQQGRSIDADTRPIPSILASAGEDIDDPRKADVTLAHLMSFSSGFDCDDYTNSPGSEDRLWEQEDEDDFWLYTARLPMLHAPGERYAYCSASINLVGSAVREAGGKPIVELFDELIAEPMEFGRYHWNVAPNGAAYLGGGPYMRPRDLLKIGTMMAEGGVWNGKRILPADWVEESTTPQIPITTETTGMTPEVFANSYFGGEAAYEWRIDEVKTAAGTYPSYEASGNGGQLLIVVPELDLSVLFMGGNYRQGGVWGRWRNEIVGGHIIPAMKDPE